MGINVAGCLDKSEMLSEARARIARRVTRPEAKTINLWFGKDFWVLARERDGEVEDREERGLGRDGIVREARVRTER